MTSQESIVKYVVKSPIMTQGMSFLRDCLSFDLLPYACARGFLRRLTILPVSSLRWVRAADCLTAQFTSHALRASPALNTFTPPVSPDRALIH
jgi:hypothetical protein